MAKGKKTGGRDWPKGFRPPGAGRPKDPIEYHLMHKTTLSDFKILMQRVLNSRPEELGNFKGNILEMTLASICQQAIKSGDPTRLEFFLNRLFGKVPDKVEYTETDELRNLNDEELYERMVETIEGFKTKLLGENKNE